MIRSATTKGSTAVAPVKSRRARRQAETRARILGAALELFGRQGFAATTVEQITEAADVGKGTFFNYFPTKEHVLSGLAEGQVAKVRQALDEAQRSKSSLREILRRLLVSLVAEPAHNAERFRSLIVAFYTNEAVRQHARRNLEEARRHLATLFALGQERGEIRRDRPPEELARFYQQSGFGMLVLWSMNPAASLAEWREATTELAWEAVGVRTRAAGRRG